MNNKFYTVVWQAFKYGDLDCTREKHYRLKEGAFAAFNRLKQEHIEKGYAVAAETETTALEAFSIDHKEEKYQKWSYFVSLKEQTFE